MAELIRSGSPVISSSSGGSSAARRLRGCDVAVGGTLYSDALGPADSGADTYVGMIRHNVDTMAAARRGSLDA